MQSGTDLLRGESLPQTISDAEIEVLTDRYMARIVSVTGHGWWYNKDDIEAMNKLSDLREIVTDMLSR